MLKDLRLPSKDNNNKIVPKKVVSKDEIDIDYDIAVDIVNDLFNNISLCLKRDRSRVKINMLAKGYIKYILSDGVREGIADFVRGMYPEDMKILLNDFERDINKRKRKRE
jgi:hypothetical protein